MKKVLAAVIVIVVVGFAVAGGGLLLVSQFTLAADTHKGMRAGFQTAAEPARAETLFNSLVAAARLQHAGTVATGQFGAHMLVTLLTRNGDDQRALLSQLREFCEARGGKIGDAAATIIQAGLRVSQVAPEALAAESEAEFKALFKKGAR